MNPSDPPAEEIDPAEFFRADIRLGTIVEARPFPEARKPAYRLVVDLGPGVGLKKSSARITERYRLEDLPGKRVLAVVNFPPRQIGPARSEVLVLGVHDADGGVVLATAEADAPDGARLC